MGAALAILIIVCCAIAIYDSLRNDGRGGKK